MHRPLPHIAVAIRRFMTRLAGLPWLDSLLPWTILLAGALSRVYVAATTMMLHADEGMHLDTASFPSVGALLHQARVAHPHPPLYLLLLYAIVRCSQELLLPRLVNIAFITASAWFFHAWLRKVFDSRVALLGLLLYFLSPGLFYLSFQVRGYSLMLLGVTGSLYYLHRDLLFHERRSFALFGLFFATALLTHYSAAFFVAAVGAYVLALAASQRPPRTLLRRWAVVAVAVVLLYGLTVVWQLGAILPRVKYSASSYLAHGLYGQTDWSLRRYLTWSNVTLLRYFLGRSGWLVVTAVVLLAALPLWFIGRSRRGQKAPWQLVAILLPLPCLLSVAAGLLGLYPHHGTRHSLVLLPFVAAALAVGMGSLLRYTGRLYPAVAALMLGYGVWASPFVGRPAIVTDDFKVRELGGYDNDALRQALIWLGAHYRAGDLVLLSMGDNFYFRHYCGTTLAERRPHWPFDFTGPHRVGRYDVYVVPHWDYYFDRDPERPEVLRLLDEQLTPGRSVWLASFLGRNIFPEEIPGYYAKETRGFGIIGLVRLSRPSGTGSMRR